MSFKTNEYYSNLNNFLVKPNTNITIIHIIVENLVYIKGYLYMHSSKAVL